MTILTVHKANLYGHSHSAQGQSVWPFSQCTRPQLYAYSHSAQCPSCMPILTSYQLLVRKSFLETRGWETAGNGGRGEGGGHGGKWQGCPSPPRQEWKTILSRKSIHRLCFLEHTQSPYLTSSPLPGGELNATGLNTNNQLLLHCLPCSSLLPGFGFKIAV